MVVSTVCVAGVIAFSVWLVLPEAKKPGTVDHFEVQKGEDGEDMRFVIGTDTTNQWRFAVKQGGITNILGTKSLTDLSDAMRQNITGLDRGSGASNGSKQKLPP